MNQRMQKEERLAQLLDRTLRELPARRAPRSLESRVRAEIVRRAAQPWWLRSFAHWPVFARAGFVATCGALAVLALLGGSRFDSAIGSFRDAGPAHAWAGPASITGAAGNFAASLASTISPAWFYGGLTAAVLLYVFLFGLGAAAYCMLYLQPHSGR